MSYNNDFLIQQRCVNESDCIVFQYDDDNQLITAGELILIRNTQLGGLLKATNLGEIATKHTYNEFGELQSMQATEEQLANDAIINEMNDAIDA